MRVSNGMRPVHPGEVLGEELEELGLSASALARPARALDVPTNRITAILNGQRGISADTALRLSRYFEHHAAVLAQPSEDVRAPRGADRIRAGDR